MILQFILVTEDAQIFFDSLQFYGVGFEVLATSGPRTSLD